MTADGHGLPLLLHGMAQRHPQRFAEIQAEFCRLGTQYRGLGLASRTLTTKRKSPRSRRLDAEESTARGFVFETCSGGSWRRHEISPGSMLLLSMLTLARLPEPPTLLLIENTEQGLYPRWLGDVIGSLKQCGVPGWPASRIPQVILSTHSPAVLNFFQPEDVTLLYSSGRQARWSRGCSAVAGHGNDTATGGRRKSPAGRVVGRIREARAIE